MKKTMLIVCAAAALTSATAAYANWSHPAYRYVDCDYGGSVQWKIDKARRATVIEIDGTCNEAIEIRKDDIELVSYTGATIAPPEDSNAAITVRNASRAAITGLNIEGGNTGIQLINGATGTISSTNISGVGIGILITERSHGDLWDNNVSDNGATGVYISSSSQANIQECILHGNGHDGVAVVVGSSANLSDNELSWNGIHGLRTQTNSTVLLSGSNEIFNNDGFGVSCESGTAIVVLAGQTFDANAAGDLEQVLDPAPACYIDNQSGVAFP